jgi:hypothetical protein
MALTTYNIQYCGGGYRLTRDDLADLSVSARLLRSTFKVADGAVEVSVHNETAIEDHPHPHELPA